MAPAQLLVDGGHLLAAAGRCAGVGGGRRSGTFDVHRLVDALLDLLPRDERGAQVRWYDGVQPGRRSDELAQVEADRRIVLVPLPLRGRRQQHVEPAVLLDLLSHGAATSSTYLVGDPRRHALAVQAAQARGMHVQLVGVADGELTPAPRIWLRRPEVRSALRPGKGQAVEGRHRTAAYRRPHLRATAVQVPGMAVAPTAGGPA